MVACARRRRERLFEKGLHLVEEPVSLGIHRHTAFLRKFREQFLLACGQLRRNLNLDDKLLVAGTMALKTRDAESFESKDLVVLCAGGNLDHCVAFQGRDFDLATHHGGHHMDGDLADDVMPFSLEDGMRLDGNRDVEITRRSVVQTRLAFVREAQPHARFDTGRDMDCNGAFAVIPLSSLAGRTRLDHNSAGPFALSAWAADAEKPLLQADLPRALATRTSLDGSRLGAGSLAIATSFPTRDFKLGFFPEDGFLEGQFEVVLEVVAALRTIAAALPTEEIVEDVVEDIAESATTESAEPFKAGSLLGAGMPKHVVSSPLFLVAERFVGFVDLFELFFSAFLLLFTGMQVRMMLAGQSPIRLL